MTVSVLSLQHVNVRVPPTREEASKHFYGTVLGLREVRKPEELQARGGAWYQLGAIQVHLSRDKNADNESSKRHICFSVADVAQAQQGLAAAGVEIIPDDEPIADLPRFYVRDPGGNLIEITELKG